jgi:D-glycero-D-manno-heptose 1,7-bisphosphate phosphatase
VNRAVFLDRDGVVNRALLREGKPYPPRRLSELEILPDVPEALAGLRAAGYRLIVVTNQPDLARGTLAPEILAALHDRLRSALPLDAICVCPHDDSDRCACRKPAPGMLLDAAQAFDLDLQRCFLVGDRWRDVEAGLRAGCRTVLIDYHYDEPLKSEPHARAQSLREASQWILDQEGEA